MIKVLIEQKENIISRINITGHANSDEQGKDLVCAGVSASSVGVLNTLVSNNFLKDNLGNLEMRDGYINIEVFHSNEVVQVILETLVITLDSIRETNEKYIKISKVEV